MQPAYSTRPIMDEDRRQAQAIMDREAASSTTDLVCVALFQAALVVGIVGGLAFLAASNWPDVRAHLGLGLFMLFLGAFVLAYRRNYEREQQGREQRRQIEAELERGVVAAARFRPVAVVVILREPTAFCYLLANGQCVLLRSAGRGRHPAAEFEVVRLPVSKIMLRCPTFGQELPVTAELPEEADSLRQPEGEPFAVNWEALRTGELTI